MGDQIGSEAALSEPAKRDNAPFRRQPLPTRFCNLQRLLDALEARGLDGIVATAPLNVFYLSGFNGIAHKSDEPRPYAVIVSRHAPEHPIMVIADYYLATFLTQPTWIEDIRPFRAVMMGPLELRVEWQDGHQSSYPVRTIRLNCRCANCVEELTGRPLLREDDIPADVRPVKISPVGRYAVQIAWTDGHDTGIYTFEHLRALCPCCRG